MGESRDCCLLPMTPKMLRALQGEAVSLSSGAMDRRLCYPAALLIQHAYVGSECCVNDEMGLCQKQLAVLVTPEICRALQRLKASLPPMVIVSYTQYNGTNRILGKAIAPLAVSCTREMVSGRERAIGSERGKCVDVNCAKCPRKAACVER